MNNQLLIEMIFLKFPKCQVACFCWRSSCLSIGNSKRALHSAIFTMAKEKVIVLFQKVACCYKSSPVTIVTATSRAQHTNVQFNSLALGRGHFYLFFFHASRDSSNISSCPILHAPQKSHFNTHAGEKKKETIKCCLVELLGRTFFYSQPTNLAPKCIYSIVRVIAGHSRN